MDTFPLEGASRTAGGILRGNALGNVFSHADTPNILPDTASVWGKIKVLKAFDVNPATDGPEFTMKAKVVPYLVSILKKLSRSYSPVSSKIILAY